MSCHSFAINSHSWECCIYRNNGFLCEMLGNQPVAFACWRELCNCAYHEQVHFIVAILWVSLYNILRVFITICFSLYALLWFLPQEVHGSCTFVVVYICAYAHVSLAVLVNCAFFRCSYAVCQVWMLSVNLLLLCVVQVVVASPPMLWYCQVFVLVYVLPTFCLLCILSHHLCISYLHHT